MLRASVPEAVGSVLKWPMPVSPRRMPRPRSWAADVGVAASSFEVLTGLWLLTPPENAPNIDAEKTIKPAAMIVAEISAIARC
jgi:hypothetical protein